MMCINVLCKKDTYFQSEHILIDGKINDQLGSWQYILSHVTSQIQNGGTKAKDEQKYH